MSTYTDLHNRVKESLNVDYHTRETNQKVLFLNPENEYYGSFHGEVDVRGASVVGGTLSDVTIVSARLSNVVLPGDINITDVGKDINALSTSVALCQHNIEDVAAEAQRLVDEEATTRQHDINLVSSNLSIAINGQLGIVLEKISAEAEMRAHVDDDILEKVTSISTDLSNGISNEISARISADEDLTTYIDSVDTRLTDKTDSLSADLSAEVENRTAACTRLDMRIDNIDNQSQERYDRAISALNEHADLNDQQFEERTEFFTDKIEHDKHYVINDEGLVETYPIPLKDYAVNSLTLSAIDGYAYHTYDDKNINVGLLVKQSADKTNTLPLRFVGIQHKDPEVFNALNPNEEFTFEAFGVPQEQSYSAQRSYSIKAVEGETFADTKFVLRQEGDTYLPVVFDGMPIGKIHAYDNIPTPITNVNKGILTITTLNSQFDPFRRLILNFDVDAGNVEIASEDARILYKGDNTFEFGYNPVRCQTINDIATNFTFAKVYDGGVVRNDVGVKSVRTKLTTLKLTDRADGVIKDRVFDSYFDLTNSQGFVNEILPFVYLSAAFNEDQSSYKFVVTEETKFYSYNLYNASDSEFAETVQGTVTVGTPNEHIEDNDFSMLSVDLTATELPAPFKQVFVLNRDKTVPEKLWKKTFVDPISEDSIQITYSGTASIAITMYKKATEAITNIRFLINVDSGEVGIDETRTVCESEMLPINTVANVEWMTLGGQVAQIQAEVSEAANTVTLKTIENDSNELKFVIPNRIANTKDYSRELLLSLKVLSPADTKINLKFVDPDGEPISISYNDKSEIFVDVNRPTVLRLTEISKKQFMITDWTEYEIRDTLKFLKTDIMTVSADLSGEIDALSASLNSEIDSLSATLSGEVDNLSVSLSGEIDNLSASLSGEIDNLSASLSGEIDDLSTALSGDIKQLSTDLSGEVDNLSTALSGEINDLSAALSGEVDDLSDALSGEIDDLSVALSNEISASNVKINSISVDVNVIQDTIKGGVNYKGKVNVIDTTDPNYDSFANSNFHISNLFYVDFGTLSDSVDTTAVYNKPVDTYSKDTKLSNGFMYIVAKTGSNLSDQWYVDGIQLDDKDYVIINCRNSGDEWKYISALTSADIDVIDALDSNLVTTPALDERTATISNDYVGKISAAKDAAISTAQTYTNTVSTDLSADYVDKIATAKSEAVSDAYSYTDTLSASLSADLSAYKNITNEHIDEISADVGVLKRRDTVSMRYFGDVTLSTAYPIAESLGELTANTLFGLISSNATINNPTKELKTGFVFHAVGNSETEFEIKSDGGSKSTMLRNNDYLFVKHDVAALSNISIDDIDIVKDYDLSIRTMVKNLSVALSGEVDDLSASLSGEIDSLSTRLSGNIDSLSTALSGDVDSLSVRLSGDVDSLSNRLSGEIDSLSASLSSEIDGLSAALSGDIDSLSGRLSGEIDSLSAALSGEVDSLSTSLSGEIDDLSAALSGEIDSLSTALSTDLSTFETEHYYRTFEKDHAIVAGPDTKVDLLKLVDDTDVSKKYTMQLSAGTLVLVPII